MARGISGEGGAKGGRDPNAGGRAGTPGTKGTHGEAKTSGVFNASKPGFTTAKPTVPTAAVPPPVRPTFPGNLSPDFIQNALMQDFWGDRGPPSGAPNVQSPMGGPARPTPLNMMAQGANFSRPGPLPGVPTAPPPPMALPPTPIAPIPAPGMGPLPPPMGAPPPMSVPPLMGVPPRAPRRPAAGMANPFIRQLA